MKTPMFLVALLFATTAIAQNDGASVTVDPLSVEGVVVGNRYDFGPEFAAEHNIVVPAPFSFIAPTGEDHLNYIQPAPGGSGIFKISFTTLDQLVKSNLQFVPMRAPFDDDAAQLDALKALLEQAYLGSVPNPDRAQVDAMRITHIGPYRAIEVIARYDGGADGIVALRIVAIPNPEGVDGIVAIINALAKNEPMESSEGIMTVDASRALGTFRFLAN